MMKKNEKNEYIINKWEIFGSKQFLNKNRKYKSNSIA